LNLPHEEEEEEEEEEQENKGIVLEQKNKQHAQKGHNNIVKEGSGYVLIPTLPAAIRFLPTITSTIPATLPPRFTDSTRLHQNNQDNFNPSQQVT